MLYCRDYPEYYEMIEHPMDLQTLKQGLAEYTSVQDVYAATKLIWNNCRTFNAEGSDIFNTANSLEQQAKALFEVGLRVTMLICTAV